MQRVRLLNWENCLTVISSKEDASLIRVVGEREIKEKQAAEMTCVCIWTVNRKSCVTVK